MKLENLLSAYTYLTDDRLTDETVGAGMPLRRKGEGVWMADDGWGAMFEEEGAGLVPPDVDREYAWAYHIAHVPSLSGVYGALMAVRSLLARGGQVLDLVAERILTLPEVELHLSEGPSPRSMTTVHGVLEEDGTVHFHSHGLRRFGFEEFSFRTDAFHYGEGYAFAMDLLEYLGSGRPLDREIRLPGGTVPVMEGPDGVVIMGVLAQELDGYMAERGGTRIRPDAVRKGDWVKVEDTPATYWMEVEKVEGGKVEGTVVIHFDGSLHGTVRRVPLEVCVDAVTWTDG